MTTSFVGKGSTLTVTPANGLALITDLDVQPGGVLDGAGAITGAFTLLNQGTILGDGLSGVLDINTGTFTNQGTVRALNAPVYIETSVNTPNLSNGTLSGGTWESYSDLRLLTGLIGTDNATIFIAGSFEDFDTIAGTMQPILNSLSVIGTAGSLILDGPNWASTGSIIDNGTVQSSVSTISAAGGITISPTGFLSTSATILSPVTVNGNLQMSGVLPTAITGTGTITALSPGLELQTGSPYTQAIVDTGAISNTNTGGIVTFSGGISGPGAFFINGGSDAATTSGIELPASLTNNLVIFDTNHGELVLDSPSTFTGKLDYFDNNDTLVLKNLIGNSASITPGGGGGSTLTISNNGIPVASFTLFPMSSIHGPNQSYATATFTATPDLLNNLTTITASGIITTICFRAGTRIATPDGEVPVEELAIGDRVLTHFAGERRVVWIGHRTIDCRRHPDPSTILPVRVAADAFGRGLPRRDLFLSPGHALFVENVLIPVKYLIDGETIRQIDVDNVSYYHVELDEHDVLFAEGLAAESYLDTGNRTQFANGGSLVALFPDFSAVTWETMGCAPLMVTGHEVTKARSILAARAQQRYPRETERRNSASL